MDGKQKHVDIKLSVQDAFLESPSPGTLKIKRLESQQILKICFKLNMQYFYLFFMTG